MKCGAVQRMYVEKGIPARGSGLKNLPAAHVHSWAPQGNRNQESGPLGGEMRYLFGMMVANSAPTSVRWHEWPQNPSCCRSTRARTKERTESLNQETKNTKPTEWRNQEFKYNLLNLISGLVWNLLKKMLVAFPKFYNVILSLKWGSIYGRVVF